MLVLLGDCQKGVFVAASLLSHMCLELLAAAPKKANMKYQTVPASALQSKAGLTHLLRGVQDVACCSADGMAHRRLHCARPTMNIPDHVSLSRLEYAAKAPGN